MTGPSPEFIAAAAGRWAGSISALPRPTWRRPGGHGAPTPSAASGARHRLVVGGRRVGRAGGPVAGRPSADSARSGQSGAGPHGDADESLVGIVRPAGRAVLGTAMFGRPGRRMDGAECRAAAAGNVAGRSAICRRGDGGGQRAHRGHDLPAGILPLAGHRASGPQRSPALAKLAAAGASRFAEGARVARPGLYRADRDGRPFDAAGGLVVLGPGAVGAAGQSGADAQSGQGPLVLPRPARTAGLFRRLAGRRDRALRGYRRADGHSLPRFQSARQRLLYDPAAAVRHGGLPFRLLHALDLAHPDRHVPPRSELERVRSLRSPRPGQTRGGAERDLVGVFLDELAGPPTAADCPTAVCSAAWG